MKQTKTQSISPKQRAKALQRTLKDKDILGCSDKVKGDYERQLKEVKIEIAIEDKRLSNLRGVLNGL